MAFSPIGVSAWCIPVITNEREGCCKDTYNNETKFYGQEVDGYRKSVTNNCSDLFNYDQGDRCTDQNYQCRVQDRFTIFGVILSTRISI